MKTSILRFVFGFFICVLFIGELSADAYQLTGKGWPGRTTNFYIDIRGANGLWNTAFGNAMHYWNAYTVFTFGVYREYEDPCDSPNSKNGAGFNDDACGDSWGDADLAYAAYWYSGSAFIEADIVFNSTKSWNVYSTSWRSWPWTGICDFQRVAVHELGHVVGLDHENSGVSTIMTSYIGDIIAPQQDDINGVAKIYEKTYTKPTPTTTITTVTTTSGGSGGGCFIATAAFGAPMEHHVQILKDFRDRHLLDYKLGQKFVNLYYRVSPQIAETISKSDILRLMTRWFLMPIVGAAYLSINFGIMATLLIIASLILLMISFVFVVRKRKMNSS